MQRTIEKRTSLVVNLELLVQPHFTDGTLASGQKPLSPFLVPEIPHPSPMVGVLGQCLFHSSALGPRMTPIGDSAGGWSNILPLEIPANISSPPMILALAKANLDSPIRQ